VTCEGGWVVPERYVLRRDENTNFKGHTGIGTSWERYVIGEVRHRRSEAECWRKTYGTMLYKVIEAFLLPKEY
jgi:hypothetical protein